ncbi:MAG: hypothetical protein ACOYIE_04670 [Agathobaculum sp.]|jgi:hypothetical protein|uniref:hypothetical protein n=1 Tax=Agathobaculum sp. TaxID=2048138 RepID=UPI003D89E679
MTDLLHMILVRVTVAGIASAVALRMAGSGALRETVRVGVGLLMLLALLRPLAQTRLPWQEQALSGRETVSKEELEAQNMQTAMSAVGASIARSLERRAGEIGIDCTVYVSMGVDAEGILQIEDITVYYDAQDAAREHELSTMLTEECGVDADRQELICR